MAKNIWRIEPFFLTPKTTVFNDETGRFLPRKLAQPGSGYFQSWTIFKEKTA